MKLKHVTLTVYYYYYSASCCSNVTVDHSSKKIVKKIWIRNGNYHKNDDIILSDVCLV